MLILLLGEILSITAAIVGSTSHDNGVQPTSSTPIHPIKGNVTEAKVGDQWTFACPHISSSYRNLTAQWMKDGVVWLEITNGKIVISNGLNSFLPMNIFDKHFVRIILKQRYTFVYNEAVGDFDLTLEQMITQDSGHYLCTIKLTNDNQEVTEKRTESVLLVTGDDRHQKWDPKPFLTQRTIPTPPAFPPKQKGHKLRDQQRTVNSANLRVTSAIWWLFGLLMLLGA